MHKILQQNTSHYILLMKHSCVFCVYDNVMYIIVYVYIVAYVYVLIIQHYRGLFDNHTVSALCMSPASIRLTTHYRLYQWLMKPQLVNTSLIYHAWENIGGGKLANCEPFINFFCQLFPSPPCIGTMLAHSPIFYSPIDSD